MHGRAVKQPARDQFRPFSPEARESRRCDLNQTALFRPFQDALRGLLKNRVPFGMGKNWDQPAISKAKEAFLEPGWNAEVAEFNQQIVGFANSVAVRLLQDAFQVFKGKMKSQPKVNCKCEAKPGSSGSLPSYSPRNPFLNSSCSFSRNWSRSPERYARS